MLPQILRTPSHSKNLSLFDSSEIIGMGKEYSILCENVC